MKCLLDGMWMDPCATEQPRLLRETAALLTQMAREPLPETVSVVVTGKGVALVCGHPGSKGFSRCVRRSARSSRFAFVH